MKRAWSWLLSRLNRRLADAHRHFGNLHGSRGDHWLAVRSYTRALAYDPAYTQAYYSRGVLHWREVDNAEGAIEDLTRVLELDSGWVEAYFNRAMAYRMRRELDLAAADLRSYLARGADEYWLESAQRQLDELKEEMDERAGLEDQSGA